MSSQEGRILAIAQLIRTLGPAKAAKAVKLIDEGKLDEAMRLAIIGGEEEARP